MPISDVPAEIQKAILELWNEPSLHKVVMKQLDKVVILDSVH